MVTVRPNFQDSVHVGHISGLKKFTDYYASVLCFTTPGDGPRSPPQRFRTHEDSECPPPLPPHPRGSATCAASYELGPCVYCRVLFAAPGAVGHLSFTDILDTSLKVSWKEPQEKNGLLTGDH